MKILVETSARHVHVSQQDLNILFGKDYELTYKKELSQPGQFASNERVTVKGEKGEISGVLVLGPVRNKTQVELSLTDARKVGIAAPIRESGKLDETPGCLLVGPCGKVELKDGVISAKRHIHLDNNTLKDFGLENGQIVNVKICSNARSVIFGDVVVRADEKFIPAMHIDTDESNAAGICGNVQGEILI